MLLREMLRRKSNALYSKFINLESLARPLLEYSQGGAHLQYPPHGLSHITAVENNYDWLLVSEDMESFNSTEIFILLSATYLHDALMIPRYQGEEKEARKNHAVRAGIFLTNNYTRLGLQLNESVAIGEVIKGHAVDRLDELDETMVLGSKKVDIRKLAACLSLSDICHADESRAPWIVKSHLELDEESEFHWSRHMQISGITRDGTDLIMSAIAFSNDGAEAIAAYKELIEAQLKICQPYFSTVLKPLNSVQLKITQLKSPLEQSFAFNTNMPEILSLLIEGVYSRKDVYIRELVQNSLDACRIRQAKSQKVNVFYQPQVILTIYSNGDQLQAVRIDDNGIGMSVKDVKDTLLWIGSSVGKNKNIASLVEETMGKQLIATFGIGILSCFRVSHQIFVASHKENESPLQFNVKDISDSFTPTESKDLSFGSTFYIEFDPNKYNVSQAEMLEAFSYYFKDVHQPELKYMSLPFDESASGRTREEIFTIARSEARPVNAGSPQSADVLYKKSVVGGNYSGLFWLDSGEQDKILTRKGTLQILNEGIFVQDDATENWLPKYMSAFDGRLNVSAKALDLTASRDLIRKNEKTAQLREDLCRKSLTLFEGLVRRQAELLPANSTLSLLIMDILRRAEEKDRENLVRRLDHYCVQLSGSRHIIALKDLANTIYVEYPSGRFVCVLTEFEGKILYHNDQEFIQLQTSLMLQEGKVVVSAVYDDSQSRLLSDSLCEIELIRQYCCLNHIEIIDLVKENVVQGMCRSKKIIPGARDLIGQQVKFIDVPSLPNKKTWVVGDQVWVNTSNRFMRDIYNILNDPHSDASRLCIAKAVIDCLSYQFDGTVQTLYSFLMDSLPEK